MKFDDLYHGHLATYQIESLFYDRPFERAFRAVSRSQNGREASVLLILPESEDVGTAEAFIRDAQRYVMFATHLTAQNIKNAAPRVIEFVQNPKPFLVVETPPNDLLADLVLEEGPLAEEQALALTLRLSAILTIVHDELELALAPLAFQEVYWSPSEQRLWMPLWRGWADAPSENRQVYDVLMAGTVLYLAFLGHRPFELWGHPLLASSRHPIWSRISWGAGRLLRRAIHPHPARRYAKADELANDARLLYEAWVNDDAKSLLEQARALFDSAQNNDFELIWKAYAILDILQRRGMDLGYEADFLRSDVEAMLKSERFIKGSINLARGGSVDVALDQLQRAAQERDESRLTLLRWNAILADPQGQMQIRTQEGYDTLVQTIQALEEGETHFAAQLATMMPSIAPLQSEIEVRTWWHRAIDISHDYSEADQALAKAQAALQSIVDPAFRVALDEELGGLMFWRQRLANVWAGDIQQSRFNERLNKVRELRESGQYRDALDLLRGLLTHYPQHNELWQEARAIGLASLQSGASHTAQESFALALSYGPRRDALNRVAWRVARCIAILEEDPSSDIALSASKEAVNGLLSLKIARADEQVESLYLALEGALSRSLIWMRAVSTERVHRAGEMLQEDWLRLTLHFRGDAAHSEALQQLELSLEHSLSLDPQATLAILNRYLKVESGKIVSIEWHEEPKTLHDILAATWRLGQRVLETVLLGDDPRLESLTVEELLKGLNSGDYAKLDQALKDFQRKRWSPGEKNRLLLAVAIARQNLKQHKRIMAQVVEAEMNKDVGKAIQLLNQGTRQGRSATAWDPKSRKWLSLEEWRTRIELLDENVVRERLEQADAPEQWEQVVKHYTKYDPQWPDDINNLIKKRHSQLQRHWQQMESIKEQIEKSPINALNNFESWRQTSNWRVCLNVFDEDELRWIPVESMYQILFDRAVPHIRARFEPLLQESRDLAEIRKALSLLAVEESGVISRQIIKMEKSLADWGPDFYYWLEKQEKQTEISHLSIKEAGKRIEALEEMLKGPPWQGFATLETPAFANTYRRLEALTKKSRATISTTEGTSASPEAERPRSPSPQHV